VNPNDTAEAPAAKLPKRERKRLEVPAVLHDEQRITWPVVEALTGCSDTTLRDLIAKGKFPAPERKGTRWTRFRAGSVLAWLQTGEVVE
jgi:predicted DNA-binding transcriptional regulator AlpA